ncbi:hypothetical protein ACFVAV_06175 [Nocardia sp. NPDC057663]|uniref:hypothetical protein n=1 Tax=Nocardia sp. NPDC057663 TaxID=3346201 RepID=UPI00366C776D
MNEPDPSVGQTTAVETEPPVPSRSIDPLSARTEGRRELAELLESLESLGLIHSVPLPQRDPGCHLAGFGPAPADYIGAPAAELSRVAAAVREWAAQPSRCRDESSPGTADFTADEPLEALRDAASALVPPWLSVIPAATQQDSMMSRMYRLARHARFQRASRA